MTSGSLNLKVSMLVLVFMAAAGPAAPSPGADLPVPADTDHAELTCVDSEKRKGFPKQKFFVKGIDGKRAGTIWSGLRKTVQLQPGQRKVVLRHMYSLMY